MPDIIMRQIGRAAAIPAVKGELQHPHPRKAAVCQEPAHGIRHIAQILRDNRLAADFFLHRPEQPHARSFSPAPYPGVRPAIGNRIVGIKAPEMIDPQHIIDMTEIPDPFGPPGIAVPVHEVPVKKRVAPELAVGGKAVGRTAGHLTRHPVFI